MQPYNPLIALSVSAVFALSLAEAAPVAASPTVASPSNSPQSNPTDHSSALQANISRPESIPELRPESVKEALRSTPSDSSTLASPSATGSPSQAPESALALAPSPSEVRQQRLAEARQATPAAVAPAQTAQASAAPSAAPAPTAEPAGVVVPTQPIPAPEAADDATETETASPSPRLRQQERRERRERRSRNADAPTSPTAQTPPSATPTESAPLPSADPPAPPASGDSQPPNPPASESTPSAPTSDEAADSPRGRRTVTSPENLNPSPNPLSFPTRPEEVRLNETEAITLEQAIDLALRNNPALQGTRLELEQAREELREAQAANLPTLDANTGLTQQGNETLQSTGSALAPTGTERTFNDSTQLDANLSLNYNIFTSGRRSAAIQAAEGRVQFQELQIEVDSKQLALDVTDDYYDLQEADEQVRIFQAALEEAQNSLRDAQALERAGVGTRFDVLQSEVDLANAQQDLTQQLSRQEVSRRTLAQRLSLAQGFNITAADPVEVAGTWTLSLEESVVQAFRNRAELEQQLVQRDIGEQRRRAALAQLGPQVSLSARYGVNNVLAASGGSGSAGLEGEGFFSNYQIQVNGQIRLFDGGAARAQARQEEASIAIAEAQFATTRDQVRLQVEQAYSTLQASFNNIDTTTLAVERAREALRLARLRFQAGVGTQTDVIQQQTALTRSEVNRLQAILDYNRSLAQLQRAVTNLPEGNLSDTP